MNLPERTEAFVSLGKTLAQLPTAEKNELHERARAENPWFTPDSVELSLQGIRVLLSEDALIKWILRYPESRESPKSVGIAMAGNIPFVGFHDFLCVLISGHRVIAKLSSQDSVMFKFVAQKLVSIAPKFESLITVQDKLKGTDAIIATGSDNTARYFEYYFRKIPHIIRKNRSSCGVLMGEESNEDLAALGMDVFSYFGLGCRNVSKLYVPEDFDFTRLIKSWEPYRQISMHHKYVNNYDYQKAILLTNQQPFLEGEFVILREDKGLVSPISVVYYEYYNDQGDLRTKVMSHGEKLQVVASAQGWFEGSVPFGKAQFPAVDDYADKVDTMAFLSKI